MFKDGSSFDKGRCLNHTIRVGGESGHDSTFRLAHAEEERDEYAVCCQMA